MPILNASRSRVDRLILVFLQGFSSGLPLLLVGSTLKLWLSNNHFDIKTIGALALLQLPYSLKFLWAPLLDQFSPPYLGRRRGWMFIFQVGIFACLMLMSSFDPNPSPEGAMSFKSFLVCAFGLAFFSASQDIVIDAYRREILPQDEFGLGNSAAILGYRIAMLSGMSLAPFLSSLYSWSSVYQVMAVLAGVGILTTLIASEPSDHRTQVARNIVSIFWNPLKDYFNRNNAVFFLCFILLFKLGDSLASELLKPFYNSLGYTNKDIGLVAGQVGFWSLLAGGFVGGLLLLKMSLFRCLLFFGILQSLSTLGFTWLAMQPTKNSYLGGVIMFENFTSGMGTSAFVTLIASLTHRSYTAAQYALLSSLTKIPLVLLGSTTGAWITYFGGQVGLFSLGSTFIGKENPSLVFGYAVFFIVCAVVALPGILLVGLNKTFFDLNASQPEESK